MKYLVDSLFNLEVMAQTNFEWTDGQVCRQTDKVTPVYPYQTLFGGGITWWQLYLTHASRLDKFRAATMRLK